MAMPELPEPCWNCVHYRGPKQQAPPADGITETSVTLVCAAFPDGIPEIVLTGEHTHRLPINGDNGVTFELDAELEEV